MRSLDEQTLDGLADLICGDGGPFYRKGWVLPKLFRNAGLRCPDHDGSTRKWWALDRLKEFNRNPSYIEKVILRLANPLEYKGEPDTTEEVIEILNKLLAIEGLKVELSGVTPILHERKPGLASTGKKVTVPLSAPDFGILTDDISLGPILAERWNDSQKCIDAGAHTAALIMMGSLLEGALLAIVNAYPKESNLSKSCPKDDAGKPKAFHNWGLNSLINVANDCGWVQTDIKDFSHSLRDYRNMVHPWHQRAKRFTPDKDTSSICWEVVKAAINDLAEYKKKRS